MLGCHTSVDTFLLIVGVTWWNVIIVHAQVTNPVQVMRFNNCSCSPQHATCSDINNSSLSTTQRSSLVTTSFTCSCHPLANNYDCNNPHSTNFAETRLLSSENLTSFEHCDITNFFKCQNYMNHGLQLYNVPWTEQDTLSPHEQTQVFVCLLVTRGCWDCTISGEDMCEMATLPSRPTTQGLSSSTQSSGSSLSPSTASNYSSAESEANNNTTQIDASQTTTKIDVSQTTAQIDVSQTTAEIDVYQTTEEIDVNQTTAEMNVNQTTADINVSQITAAIIIKHTTVDIDVKHTTTDADVKHTTSKTDINNTTKETQVNKTTEVVYVNLTTAKTELHTTVDTGVNNVSVTDFNSSPPTASNTNTSSMSQYTRPSFETSILTDHSTAFNSSTSNELSNPSTTHRAETSTSASTLTSTWPVMNPTANVTEVTSSSLSSPSSSSSPPSSSSSSYRNPNTINLSERTHDYRSTCCPTSASDITSFSITYTTVQNYTEVLNSTNVSVSVNTKNPNTTVIFTSNNSPISEAATTDTTQYQAVSDRDHTENTDSTNDAQKFETEARSTSTVQSDSFTENYTQPSTDFSTPLEIIFENKTAPTSPSTTLNTGESASNKGDEQYSMEMRTIIIVVSIVGSTVLLVVVVSLILLKRRRQVNSKMQFFTSRQLEVFEITKTTETHLRYFNQRRGISDDTKLITSF